MESGREVDGVSRSCSPSPCSSRDVVYMCSFRIEPCGVGVWSLCRCGFELSGGGISFTSKGGREKGLFCCTKLLVDEKREREKKNIVYTQPVVRQCERTHSHECKRRDVVVVAMEAVVQEADKRTDARTASSEAPKVTHGHGWKMHRAKNVGLDCVCAFSAHGAESAGRRAA